MLEHYNHDQTNDKKTTKKVFIIVTMNWYFVSWTFSYCQKQQMLLPDELLAR